jgi:hypothetical protein
MILLKDLLMESIKDLVYLEKKSKSDVEELISKHYLAKYPSAAAPPYGVMFKSPEGVKMVGAIIYGQTSKPNEYKEIAVDEKGESLLKQGEVFELLRLYLSPDIKDHPDLRNLASYVISRGNSLMKSDYPEAKVIITRADSGQGHVGSIYQATNAIYLGKSNDQLRPYDKEKKKFIYRTRELAYYGFKDWRAAVISAKEDPKSPIELKMMTGKHFYIYILSGPNSTEGKRILSNLTKDIQPYPKKSTELIETLYQGNVGIHELMMFYQSADESLISKVDAMFKSEQIEQAWHTVKDYLQLKGQLVNVTLEKKTNV